MAMLTLVLTRHGLTDRSIPEQHLGQKIDISINDAGRRQGFGADLEMGRRAGVDDQRLGVADVGEMGSELARLDQAPAGGAPADPAGRA